MNNSELDMQRDFHRHWRLRRCVTLGVLLVGCCAGHPIAALAAEQAAQPSSAAGRQAQPAENALHADAPVEGRTPPATAEPVSAVQARPADAPNTRPVDAPNTRPVDAPNTRPVDAGFEPFPRKSPAAAATVPMPAAPPATDAAPEAALQDATQQLATLERDLGILEEDLLYPPSSRVAVYLSMDVGDLFALDEVEVKINGTTVAHHLYTEQQVDALHRGGIQRLYVGNARQGDNEITAFFLGRGQKGESLRRATTAKFTKSFEPAYVELKIADSETKQRPVLSVEVH